MALDDLRPFFGDLVDSVNIVVQPPARIAVTPRGRVVAVPSASITMPSALVTAASTPSPDLIIIHPRFANTESAEGLALLSHEFVHIRQWRTVSDFQVKYDEAEAQRVAAGLPPWHNYYEWPAYKVQTLMEEELSRSGFPLGRSLVPAQARRDIFGAAQAEVQEVSGPLLPLLALPVLVITGAVLLARRQ